MNASKAIVATFIAVPQNEHSLSNFSARSPVNPGEDILRFRCPCNHEAGQLAFKTSILNLGVKTPAIFAGNRIVARRARAAPDESGKPQSFSFRDFLDPVIDEQGHIAFTAEVSDLAERTREWVSGAMSTVFSN
jgi:hypothetical protein